MQRKCFVLHNCNQFTVKMLANKWPADFAVIYSVFFNQMTIDNDTKCTINQYDKVPHFDPFPCISFNIKWIEFNG